MSSVANTGKRGFSRAMVAGIAGKVLARFRSAKKKTPGLALVERIALGPRQSLALVEAEGRRFLEATSADGGPAFLALDERESPQNPARCTRRGTARVSW